MLLKSGKREVVNLSSSNDSVECVDDSSDYHPEGSSKVK